MKAYQVCPRCVKKPYLVPGLKCSDEYVKRTPLPRMGEGYIVLSISNGRELSMPCHVCKGEGWLFVKEYEVDKNVMLDKDGVNYISRNG